MRRLAWFAGALSAGVFLAVYLLPEGARVPGAAVCALAALAGLLLDGTRRLRVLLVGFGLAAGLLWTGVYGSLILAPAAALSGSEGTVEAQVTGWPEDSGFGSRVLARLHPVEGGSIPALLYLEEGAPDLRPGDTVRVTAELRTAGVMAGDPTDYYYARGIRLIAYARGPAECRRPERPPVWSWPAYVSRALQESVARIFPDDAAPLVTALLTGDKSQLPAGTYSDLQRAGLAHVVAVSGLHVSFLSGLVSALLGRRRRRSAVVGIALMAFFAAVAGATPSVLRAVFMQSMLLLAPLLGREEDPPTALSTILMLLLLYNPYAAASVSLQLSFAATAGICLFTGPLCAYGQARLPARPKGFWPRTAALAANFLLSSLAVTLGALAFTTPLTALHFQSISLAAPLSNLLGLWAVSDAFLGGLAAAVLGLVLPGPARLLAEVVTLPVRYLLALAGAIARLPFASVSTQSVYLRVWLALAYALLLLWLLGRRRGGRPLLPVGLATAALCAALVFQAADRSGGALTVSVLDVGQGLSVALCSQGQIALVDCGGSGAEDAGDVAADYVQSLGRSRIDLLVLTHYHEDHAGGVPELLERVEVGLLVLPDVEEEDPLRQEILALAAERGIDTLLLGEDTRVALGEASLRIYAPLGSGGSNEEGLSVLCTAGDFDALITGDMNDTVERRLVKYGALPDTELLVVGHHGSKYATSEELLLAARPETAVISVGYNSYGHPAPETLERLAAAGCAVYRTDWSGTVTITAT